MKNFWIAALLAFAPPQEDLDARLEALAAKLSKEGASGQLAELCASEFGRAAIREKIDALVNHRAGRIDRDAQGHYEERMFARDEAGALALRPERKAEFDRLAAEVAAAPKRMAAFNRRALAHVGRIAGDGPLEQKARAWWSDSTFRIAYFTARAGELREVELPEILHEMLGKGVIAGADGKARADQPLRDTVGALAALLDQIKDLERAYLKNLAEVGDDARRTLVTETAGIFFLGRILRQAQDGVPEPIGTAADLDTGEKSVTFSVPLADLLDPFREAQKTMTEFGPWFDKTAAALSGPGVEELEVANFLKNDRARMLIAERLLGARDGQRARLEAIFAEIAADGYEAQGDQLTVKKGRYPGEDGADSPDVLDAEHKGLVDGFWGGRYFFDLLAEHCADPKTAEVFASPAGTASLHEDIARVQAELRQAIAGRGFDFFSGLYLAKKGDGFEVRPERAAKIQELVLRAAQLRKDAGQ